MSALALNLVVIRAANLDETRRFYEMLGLAFLKEQHGTGSEHYSCEIGATIFEIYPANSHAPSSDSLRLGFRVPSIDAVVEELRKNGVTIVTEPKDSRWGRRAVVCDPNGHRVELSERG